jgi:hypothetical protein
VSERVLTFRELNRATLARQLLLRRRRISVPRAVEAVGALQAQFPPSPYIALWSRVEGFRREQLFRSLERRKIVKATLQRGTLHLVSSSDYLGYAGVFTRTRTAQQARRLVDRDLEEQALQVEALAEEPLSRQELLHRIGERPLNPADRPTWIVWHLIQARAALLLEPESAAWRMTTGRARFIAASAWLGERGADGPDAVDLLVRRYLRAFGPASVADATQWTGLPAGVVRESLERRETRRFRDESGRLLFDLPRAPLPESATHAPVRFLPMWDSLLLAHADRRRVLAEDYRRVVIRKNGDVQQTFLVDGVVAGTWMAKDGRVAIEPFAPLPRVARRAVEDEERRLELFLSSTAA